MKKWKCLFFSLLLINVVFLIIGTVLALQPSKEREYSILQKEWKESESLSIFVKKEDINVLINKYLQTKINNFPLNLEVRLTDKVEVYGTIQAFGNELDISMNFKPEVQENGDILLKLLINLWSTTFASSSSCCLQASHCSFTNNIPFKFCKN